MKKFERKSIHGRKVTRKQALRGLGNPKTWKKDKEKLMKEFRSKPFVYTISQELCKLSRQMEAIGIKMEYYGGFSEMGKHGRELIGAAKIAREWADNIVY